MPISGNKEYCDDCVKSLNAEADLADSFNEVSGVAPREGATHILMCMPSRDQEFLYRADGMLCSTRHKDKVLFGDDIATMQSRLFMNIDSAKAWIRRIADVDLYAENRGERLGFHLEDYRKIPVAAVIEERDGESMVVLAHDGAERRIHLPGQLYKN